MHSVPERKGHLFNFDNLFSLVARAVVLVTAMPVHEYAHGYVADRLGDDTARKQGRLTLNPFAHLDLLGSLLILFSGFGWAKPVPVNSGNFKHPKGGMALTALAGPLSNILMATLATVVYKLLGDVMPVFRNSDLMAVIYLLLGVIISTNLGLAVFNLLPVPPLDGSKIFAALLPDRFYYALMRYERYVMLALFALIFFTDILSRPLSFLAEGLLSFIDLITSPLGRF